MATLTQVDHITFAREQSTTKIGEPALLADASMHLHIVFYFALGAASNSDVVAREKARA